MKNFLLIICFSAACFLHACTQPKTGIQNSYAFFRVSVPGNLPVDDSGNPLKTADTVRIIYIETKGNHTPAIESVRYGNRLFSSSVFAEDKLPVAAGRRKNDGREVSITPRKGNRIWRIELTTSETMQNSRSKNIVLTGMLNGSRFERVISREIELESEIRG